MLCKIHSRLIARPPLILATIVARLLLLTGKSLFAYGLRARRRPPRTREKYDLMQLAVGVRIVRIVRNVRTGRISSASEPRACTGIVAGD